MFARLRATKVYKPRHENPSKRDFIQFYRFTTENVEWIAKHFLDDSEEKRGGAMDNLTKMKTFLIYVSDPDFQVGVSEDIGINQPTVSNVVKFVTQQIVNKVDTWIRFPQNSESLEAEKLRWLEKYRFPTATGLLDCTLIKTKKNHPNRNIYVENNLQQSMSKQPAMLMKYLQVSVHSDQDLYMTVVLEEQQCMPCIEKYSKYCASWRLRLRN